MNTFTCTVFAGRKSLTLSPVQLSIYRQCQIVEAMDPDQKTYYLFFIKDTFLHAAQLNDIPTASMLSRILQDGIGFPGTHPLTEALLSNHSTLSSIPQEQLVKKLFSKYGPLDTALFLTFFEGCLPTETLRLQLKKIFYHFRRNGQLSAAYKSLRYYLDFASDDSFASDMLNNLSFHHYADRYLGLSMSSIKDKTFLEFLCFDRLYEPEYLEALVDIYQKENRWIDELASRCDFLSINKDQANLQAIQTLIQQKFTTKQQTLFFQNLLSSLPHTSELRAGIFNQLISQKNHTEVIRFLLDEQADVSPDQLSFLTISFQHIDLNAFSSQWNKMNRLLLQLYREQPSHLEPILHRFVCHLLKEYELAFIKEWISLFTEADVKLPIADIIGKMCEYQEDPDQQFALGKLYLYFDQYEKSIDCFKWEMELNPADTAPIQYLIKVYAHLGEKTEKEAYTQLLNQTNKKGGAVDQH